MRVYQNEYIGIAPDDPPVELGTAVNCVFHYVGTTFGRFIFTDWGTLARVTGRNACAINCVFLGNGQSGYAVELPLGGKDAAIARLEAHNDSA